jgi:hypothetical protein
MACCDRNQPRQEVKHHARASAGRGPVTRAARSGSSHTSRKAFVRSLLLARFLIALIVIALPRSLRARELNPEKGRASAATSSAAPLSIEVAARRAAWDGYGEFETMLRNSQSAREVVAHGRLPYAELKPEDTVFLIAPDRSLDVASLGRFLKEGGRVVLLDDFGTGDELLRYFGMKRVPLTSKGSQGEFPLAEPVSAHPTTSDLATVHLNHASAIEHHDLSSILVVHREDRDAVVAVAGAVKNGRFFVVSDASVVINEMMQFTGNKTFAKNLIDYAMDDDVWGKRHGRAFVVSGEFEQVGAYGEAPGLRAELQELGRQLSDWSRQIDRAGLPREGLWFGAWALAAMIAGFAISRGFTRERVHTPRHLSQNLLAASPQATLLGLPGTPKSLFVLAWRDALAAFAEARLGLEEPGSDGGGTLVRLSTDARLDTVLQAEARALHRFIREQESELVRGSGKKLSAKEAAAFGERCEHWLRAADKQLGLP